MLEYEVGSLAIEFRSNGAALFGHLIPRSGEHSRLKGCPVSLDPYSSARITIEDEGGFVRHNTPHFVLLVRRTGRIAVRREADIKESLDT